MQLKQRQVVLVGRVVAVPGHDVERRVIDARRPEPAQKFRGDVKVAVAIFEGGDGRFEVARVGEAIGADGPEFGQAKRQAVVLADVSAGLLVDEDDAELDAARDDADLAGRYFENAQFGVKAQRSELRNDQHLAVGGIEEAILHGGIGGIEMNGEAGLHRRIAIAAERDDAVDEVRLLFGQWQRIPAELIRSGGRFEERAAANQARGNLLVRAMGDRGANAIGPGAAIRVRAAR